MKQYVDILPKYLTRRFISADEDAVVVNGRVPDIDASQLLPVIRTMDRELAAVRVAHPDYKIAVTGLSAIAARNSATMIDRLSQALTIEIAFVAAFIGIAFRSPVVMLVSILPGIFPVVLAGGLLLLLGMGLQFASVIALTVSFGLGLSRDDPLPQPVADRGHGCGRSWRRCRARDGAGRPAADFDIRGARLRPRDDGVLRPALVAHVRLAERLRDDRGADRRPVHPAAGGDVLKPNPAPLRRPRARGAAPPQARSPELGRSARQAERRAADL